MSLKTCLRCEWVRRVPTGEAAAVAGAGAGGPGQAAELRCGRIDRMVDVCLTVMGCPKGKFKAGAKVIRRAVEPASQVEVDRRRGVCGGCDDRTGELADGLTVVCDQQLRRCSAGGGRVSLTVGSCPLKRWATNSGGSTGG